MLVSKIKKQIEALNLDLHGRTVLTEAATGAYVVTPIIAALAGARVFAFSKTTHYGTVEDVFANTRAILNNAGVACNIEFIDKITPEIISQADVITNSGHLRPLNEELLQHAKDSVVIPLMYEAWEFRDADLDIKYIQQRGFRIGATNERHQDVDVFNYLGDMAIKQIFDAGICPYRNKFVLLCNNDFGPYIAKVVARLCDGVGVIDKPENADKYKFENVDFIGNFPNVNIPEKYRDAEAVIFTAYPFDFTWIGKDSPINIQELKQNFQNPLMLRYAGDVDSEMLKNEGIRYFPEFVKSGHMGVLPSAIGFDPIIRLQSGGLKVAESLLTGNYIHKNSSILELL
jgi:hypothetical protein